MNINPKFKNPVFIAGIIAVLFGSAGVDFQTLTSWHLLFEAIIGILQNPVSIMAVVVALYAQWNNNDTKQLDRITIREKKVDLSE